MAFTSPITAVTGATFTAAQFNSSVRDNINALWVGTTAGDLDYYSSGTAKSRLAIGTAGYSLKSTGTAPAWADPSTLKGALHTKAIKDFTPAGTWTGTTPLDITGGTVNITTSVTCTVWMRAYLTINQLSGLYVSYIRGVIGATADTSFTVYQGNAINDGFNDTRLIVGYEYYLTGVAAGTITCKLQAYNNDPSASTQVWEGRLLVQAFAE